MKDLPIAEAIGVVGLIGIAYLVYCELKKQQNKCNCQNSGASSTTSPVVASGSQTVVAPAPVATATQAVAMNFDGWRRS